MPFDWERFLDQHNVEYQTSGRTAAGDNISINCPFCSTDSSFYLSISLKGLGWHCWRSAEHRGRSPVRLIQALTGCSWEQAAKQAGDDRAVMSINQLSLINMASLSATTNTLELQNKLLLLPSQFRPFPGALTSLPFVTYLQERGVSIDDAITYNLHYCTHGDYRGRIILPIYHDHHLVSWTGRSISTKETLRYKDASDKETGVAAKNYLMFYDYLVEGGDTLILTEGPFDALKVNILGEHIDVLATCSMTSFYTDAQLGLLEYLLPKFNRCLILLDQGAHHTAMRLQSVLLPFRTTVKHLPSHRKDPAQLVMAELIEILAD